MTDKNPAKVGVGVSIRKQGAIAVLAVGAIGLHLLLRFGIGTTAAVYGWATYDLPLIIALVFGGAPLLFGLLAMLFRLDFGADLLAGLSIVTSLWLEEYLAGTIVVLMLSGGEALEAYAVRKASSVLEALAKRMPSLAHRKLDGAVADVPLDDV